ncbi:MAG: T9SS type A sorting domain-containing protein [Flavobacteriales bacterium]|nr:T9SS type A sorting domain-containing protein [Flavobacteriales bacterium]
MKILKFTIVLIMALCCQSLAFAQCENDTTPPVITVPDDITIDCDEDWPPIPAVTCWDDCDQALIPTFTFWFVENKCGFESMILLWAATDQAGNSTSATQVVMQCDLSPPVFEDCPPDVTVSCEDGVPEPPELTVTDVCDGPLVPILVEDIAPGDCDDEYTVTRTWTATDSHGNSSDCVQVITVIDDTAPFITGYGPDDVQLSDMTVECNAIPEPMEANAFDTCDDDVEVVFTSKIIPGLCDDSYMIYRAWEAVDNCGNTSPLGEQTLTVVDTTAPELVFDQSDPQVEACDVWINEWHTPCGPGEQAEIAGPAGTDLTGYTLYVYYANGLSGTYGLSGIIPDMMNGYGVVTRSTNPTPDNNLYSFAITDNNGDVIHLSSLSPTYVGPYSGGAANGMMTDPENVSNAGNHGCGSTYLTGAGSQYSDFTAVATPSGNGNNTIGTLNPGQSFIGTAGNGECGFPLDLTVECDEIPDALEASATDNCDGDVDISFSESSTSWDDCEYYIYRTWTATDNCGNSSSHTQTITVTDSNAPVLSSLPADMSLDCTDPIPAMAVLTADDVCSGTVDVYSYEDYDYDCPGQYDIIRYWYAYDDCGNFTDHTQVISISDTNGPSIIHNLDLEITVECDAIPAAEELTAVANCSDAFVSVSEVIIDDYCFNDYTYVLYRLYVATDECGNTSSVTQTIHVQDFTAPTFDTLPADADIDCPNEGGGEPDEVTATDNCDENPSVWYSDNYEDCAINRTWYAQDNCGNLTTHLQVLSFNDEEAPTFTFEPENMTVSCEDVPEPAEVGAEDNCSTPFVSLDEKTLPGSCANSYILLRTWTAQDACDNVATQTQVITVYDYSAPTWDQDMPESMEHPCDEPLPAVPSISATDNCGSVTIDYNEYFEDYNGCEGFYVRQWWATDECGNSTYHSQTITLTDDEAPEFFFDPDDDQVACNAYSAIMNSTGGTSDQAIADFIGVPLSEIEALVPQNATTGSVIKQEISTVAGDVLTFDHLYNTSEGSNNNTYNDFAFAVICQNGAVLIADTFDPENVWTLNSHVINSTGTCTLAFGVLNATDGIVNTFMRVDNIQGVSLNDGSFESGALAPNWDSLGNASVNDDDSSAGTTDCFLSDLVVECDEVPAPWDAPVSDNCDDDIFVSYSETNTPGDCANEYTLYRVWTAYDNCGNSTTVDQEITVIDTTAPEFVDFPADEILYCDPDVPPVVSPTATDNCDSFVDITFVQTIEYGVSFGSVGTDVVTRTWTATDDCGNSTTQSQQITLVADCPSNGCVSLYDFLDAPDAMTIVENPSTVEFYWDVPSDAVVAQARITSSLGTTYHIMYNLDFPKIVSSSFFQNGIEYDVDIRYASQVTPCIIASQWSDASSFTLISGGSSLAQDGNPFEAEDVKAVDFDDSTLSIFPNPNNGNFTVDTNLEEFSIEIYNVDGKLIESMGNFYNGQNQLELNGYASGVYMLRIFNDTESLNTRFVIQ